MMQNDIKILIIEDEEIWSKAIALDLNDFGYTVAGIASTFEDAIAFLNNTTAYDLVLLDIKLGNRNSGIEIGKLMHQLYKKPYIFMTASHDSHTLHDLQDAHPSAYLIKPMNPSSLIISIQNAINNFTGREIGRNDVRPAGQCDFFFVKHGSKYKKIAWSDIVYLRSDRNYTYIFNSVDKTEYPIRSSLSKTIEHIIPQQLQPQFIQINRAEVVKTSFILEISGNEIVTPFMKFACTDAYLKEVKNELKIIM